LQPEIALVKTGVFNDTNGNSCSDVGETITYTFRVTNQGNVSLTGVSVSDTEVPIITFVSGDTNVNNQLDSGETWEYSGTYSVTQIDIDAGVANNQATAQGTGGTQTVSDLSGTAIGNNTTTSTVLCQTSSIATVKTFANIDVGGLTEYTTVGQVITYSITLENTGNVTVYNPTMTDATATTGPTYVSGDGGIAAALDTGETWTYTATYTVTQADIDNGSYTNLAEGSGSADTTGDGSGDTLVESDEDETVNATQTTSIATVKTFANIDGGSATAYATVGELINYTISLTNDGNVTVYNATMADATADAAPARGTDAPGNNDAVLEVGETWNYTASHTVTQADIDTGSYLNTARCDGSADTTGDGSGDTLVESNEDETVNATQTTSIATVKSFANIDGGLATAYATVGELINYTISLTNDGNVSVYNATMADATADAAPARGTDAPGNNDAVLEVGETWNYTASHTVTQADIDTGSYTNTAEGDGSADTDGDGIGDTPVDSDESETVNASQTTSIALVKTGVLNDINGDGCVQVGETVTYSFEVTNTGNVTVTNITVTDPLVPVTGGAITLGIGASNGTNFTAVYVITQGDLNAGQIDNQATAQGTGGGSMVSDLSGTAISNDDLIITTLTLCGPPMRHGKRFIRNKEQPMDFGKSGN
jgi:uncharacterized repeat protein (TIGR01451 family)